MRKILLDIYHGNITPSEKAFKKNPEYTEAAKALSDSEAFLKNVLTDEGKAHLPHMTRPITKSAAMIWRTLSPRGFVRAPGLCQQTRIC